MSAALIIQSAPNPITPIWDRLPIKLASVDIVRYFAIGLAFLINLDTRTGIEYAYFFMLAPPVCFVLLQDLGKSHDSS